MSRIRETIQVDQLPDLLPPDDVLDDVRADEARAAGDEQVHDLMTTIQIFIILDLAFLAFW